MVGGKIGGPLWSAAGYDTGALVSAAEIWGVGENLD